MESVTSKGGYAVREDSIPTWVAHAEPSKMQNTQIDAITGATPSTGTYSYIWDGTDDNGNKVTNGIYTFHVEAAYTEDTEQNRNMLSNVTAEYVIDN